MIDGPEHSVWLKMTNQFVKDQKLTCQKHWSFQRPNQSIFAAHVKQKREILSCCAMLLSQQPWDRQGVTVWWETQAGTAPFFRLLLEVF